MDEKYAHVFNALREEIKGANGYMDMYVKASEVRSYDGVILKGLHGMAVDECSHAKFIKYWLEKCGVTIPEDIHTSYTAMETRMQTLFR